MHHEEPSFLKSALTAFKAVLAAFAAGASYCLWVWFSLWISKGKTPLFIGVLCGGVVLALFSVLALLDYRRKRGSLWTQVGRAKRGSVQTNAVIMPVSFLKPPPSKLHQFDAGMPLYIHFTDVAVDIRGRTWVETEATTTSEPRFGSVKVELKCDGSYILTLPTDVEPKFEFIPKALSPLIARYAPVSEIKQESFGSLF